MSELFTAPALRVEQPRRGSSVRYRVLDDSGTLLAVAERVGERRRGDGVRNALRGGASDLDARAVTLSTPDGEPLFEVDKAAGRTLITLRRPDGTTIGTYNTRYAGREFTLRDPDEHKVGSLVADLAQRNFTITDPDRNQVGTVRKRFAGIATHLLTTADKYDVEIADDVPEPLRTLVVGAAIAMDLALHEHKEII
ncbi:phospholipid scramblase-related protein [Actinomadura atramentaria]|uniref:phospholipid scramblase-related protein n=1 Tax=Actinomadura atramentaria TaxID=1990 RepID=UPI000379C1E8|nr:phospholipid scramblase-related protein [Actinomadura atramentaria]